MCWRNGGCFIKVGQHIGALDYLLPTEYVNTMKVLHQFAPESSVADIKHIIAADLGHTLDELFVSFDECPIASASLAQVHRATIRGSGKVVAVKVQHPLIKAHSAVDMATMEVNAAVNWYQFYNNIISPYSTACSFGASIQSMNVNCRPFYMFDISIRQLIQWLDQLSDSMYDLYIHFSFDLMVDWTVHKWIWLMMYILVVGRTIGVCK